MLTLIFTLLSAIYDNGKRFTDHTDRFIFRVIVVAIISFIEAPQIIAGNYLPYITTFAFNTAIFYGAFDYTLNVLEGRKWNYIGNTAKIDKLWNKYGGWKSQLIFKIILLITTYILTWL